MFKIKTGKDSVNFVAFLDRSYINAPAIGVVRSAGEESNIGVILVIYKLFIIKLKMYFK